MTASLADLERQFWRGDAEFYRDNLTDDAVMVFPDPVGIMDRDATVAAIAGGARWQDVALEDVRVITIADDVAILVYRAVATRAGADDPYRTLASSTYVRRDGRWRLAVHQQTPAA